MRASTEAHWTRFWRERAAIEDVYPTAGRVVDQILAVGPVEGKRFLEVGAGSGRDSVSLAQRGATTVMLDYSVASLEVARAVARSVGVTPLLVRADALRMPFRDGAFDTVFHQGLLEHFRKNDAQKLLRENIRVVKPGGLLLVDVPQRYHIYTILKHILILIGRWFAGWEREFSIRELKRVVEGEGIQVIHTYGEWMYPSLFYRAIREALRKMNIYLPFQPSLFRPLSNLRASIRSRLWHTSLALYTSISIGVIARKGRT